MEKDPVLEGGTGLPVEGRVQYIASPTGKEKGPGTKGSVFYNPAMVNNRDMSILFIQTMLDSDMFPGSGPVTILDGLTGSGIRAVRLRKELDPGDRDLEITGVDLKEDSIESAISLARLNNCDVDFHQGDLNSFYGNRRFHYIDIDPFGTPVPFIQNALTGSRRGGILAVTATDTAALTGSVPRVARRRYGITNGKTHFMQEMGARSLLGYVARMAASFEISVEPLFFYTQDHFIRGYLRLERGAKKADRSLDDVGYFRYRIPYLTEITGVCEGPGDMQDGRTFGPVWTGELSDRSFVENAIENLRAGGFSYLSGYKSIEKMLVTCISEDRFPPGGFDVNETSSHLKCSPPSMDHIESKLEEAGFGFSRSRFSPTIVKTDAPGVIFEGCFNDEEGH